MKTQILDYKLVAVIIGALLFNYLFWMERLALNMLLYSIYIFAFLIIDQKITSRKAKLLIGTHFLAAVLVVINNSDLNVLTWYISLAVTIGFVYAEKIKSVFTAVFVAFLQFVTAPINLVKRIINIQVKGWNLKPVLKLFKYIILPFVIVFIFAVIYSNASPIFGNYFEQILEDIGQFIQSIFQFFFADLSFARFMHLVLGLILATALFIKSNSTYIDHAENGSSEVLVRHRVGKKKKYNFLQELSDLFLGKSKNRNLALKTENIIGVISFAALNVLLLLFNLVDIQTLYFGKIASNYSEQLHDGTNALITSIILAMAVILYFFNGNLNFYNKNKTLKILAFLWIVQNGFLIISVIYRDYNYIDMHGLTYKRIGVGIFLMLCTIGLHSVYIKVAKQKTLFYLLKTNGMIWYSLLLFFGLFNWDVIIVSYNIANSKNMTVDVNHLMSLSDKTLPILDKNKALIKSINGSKINVDEFLNERNNNFKERLQNKSLLSWNYQDWRIRNYFLGK